MTSLSERDLERLAALRTIDLTTYGRRSGLPRRIEIWWFHVDGRFIVTGTPGKRDWLANVTARPEVIIHAGGMDTPATVRPIGHWRLLRGRLDHHRMGLLHRRSRVRPWVGMGWIHGVERKRLPSLNAEGGGGVLGVLVRAPREGR
ncbi:MAG: nitroreductase/quinone reductase family protein [Acidimicrobiia bacterium]